MKTLFAFIAATFAAFFATTPAFAVGAAYEVPVTVEFTAAGSFGGLFGTVTATVDGTFRDAVNNHTSTVDATDAAIAECRQQAANPNSRFLTRFLDGFMSGAAVSLITIEIDDANCAGATDGTFADNEYAAFVIGASLNATFDDGDFTVYFAVNSVRASAIATAADSCEAIYGPRTPTSDCYTAASDIVVYRGRQTAASGDDDDDPWLYFGGAAAVAVLAWWYWDGNPAAFTFSPDAGYSLTETGRAYHAGGRVDFRQDNLHLFWAAGGGSGNPGYASGGEWNKDIWRAAFSETVRGKTADYDFSLSAKYGGGIWEASPIYRLHSRFADGESETRNSLNLEGLLRLDRWVVRPSAGFRWREMDEFGENARVHLSAVRQF